MTGTYPDGYPGMSTEIPMTLPGQGFPLMFEDSPVFVPVREAAQRAFEEWLAEKADEIDELLEPWGLSVGTIQTPILHRIVLVGDERYTVLGVATEILTDAPSKEGDDGLSRADL